MADCRKHSAAEYDFIPRTEGRDASLLDDQAAEQCRYEIDFLACKNYALHKCFDVANCLQLYDSVHPYGWEGILSMLQIH